MSDISHLQLLAIFHYILGGFIFLFGCFPLIYVVMGILMMTNASFLRQMDGDGMHSYQSHEEMQEDVLFGGEAPPRPIQVEAETDLMPEPSRQQQQGARQEDQGLKMMGGFMTFIGLIMSFGGWLMAGTLLFAGRSLQKRKRLLYCQVVAGVSCMLVPLGTVLGVFTIVALQRPSIAAAFKRV